MKQEEFNLSERILIDSKRDYEYLLPKDVKEFIKRLNEYFDDRIKLLSEFDGLGEVMLQKSEIHAIEQLIDKLAGKKLI